MANQRDCKLCSVLRIQDFDLIQGPKIEMKVLFDDPHDSVEDCSKEMKKITKRISFIKGKDI